MIVHTINKPDIWPSCNELFTQDDELVLLEDGVYLALDKVSKACAIQALSLIHISEPTRPY